MVVLPQEDKQTQRGFSLPELILAVGMISIVMTSMYFFIQQGFTLQRYSYEQSRAIGEARRGVETMIREIREIQTADNGAFPIVHADDNEFAFYADIDKDYANERVRYFLDGTVLKKGTIEPRNNPSGYFQADEVVTVLSQHIHNESIPAFRYFDGSWPNGTSTDPLLTPAGPTEVKFVSLTLVINVDPDLPPANFTLTSDVTIRNLKDNL